MSVSLILDVVIAAILLLCLVIGGSRGFVSSLLSVVILAVALVGSGIVANLLADPVTDWVTPRVQERILDRLTDGHSQEAVTAAAASDNEALAGLVDFDAICWRAPSPGWCGRWCTACCSWCRFCFCRCCCG